jgi:hypothetical protein
MPLKEVVGSIYSLQPLPSRWLSLLAMGTTDSLVAHRTCIVHCPVHAMSARLLGFGVVDRWNPLFSSGTGQSGGTLDMSGAFWLCCLTSARALFAFTVHCSRPLVPGYRCSVGSPDMSGAHRTVRWIIAEHALKKPESGLFAWCSFWCTGHCPLGHLPAHSHVLLQILLIPQLNFFLGLCWTLCTWDKWHLDRLVSPRGLWWTSTTKIDYRKWLSSFPFQFPPFWWLMPTQTKANIECKTVTSLQLWLMCIGYLELNQLKDFVHMSKNKRDCFLLFNILDHICTTCLILQIFWKNIFKFFCN